MVKTSDRVVRARSNRSANTARTRRPVRDAGMRGGRHPRRTVFLEIFAADENEAAATVRTLPMSKWWDLDVYPCPTPTPPTAAS